MIGILIVAHDTLRDSLIQAVTHVLGARPPQFETLARRCQRRSAHLLPRRAMWSRRSTAARAC